MTVHYLKTHPEHFAAIASGVKTAELRKDDRGYAVGDILVLQKWSPGIYDEDLTVFLLDGMDEDEAKAEAASHAYSGDEVFVVVSHVLKGDPWLAPEYAMLSFHAVPRPVLEAFIKSVA